MNGRKGSEEKNSKDNEENGKENLKKTQESVLYKIEDIPPW